MVFRKGLSADKFYPYFAFESIIKIQNFVFVHFKFSCQSQLTSKTMASKTKWRQGPNYTRLRNHCVFVSLLSEDSFRWLKKCIQWFLSPELSPLARYHDHFSVWQKVVHRHFKKYFTTFYLTKVSCKLFKYMQFPKWDRTRCLEELMSSFEMSNPLQMCLETSHYKVKSQIR